MSQESEQKLINEISFLREQITALTQSVNMLSAHLAVPAPYIHQNPDYVFRPSVSNEIKKFIDDNRVIDNPMIG